MKSIHSFLISTCLLASLIQAQSAYQPGPQTSTFSHIVVIFQENRTPDNLFYNLCTAPYGTATSCSTTPNNSQYNIQTKAWANAKSTTGVTTPTPIALNNKYDLSHAHSGFNDMCDLDPATGNCKMDGAINVPCGPQAGTTCPAQPQYKYVDNSKGIVNPYLDLATQYGWANFMFQTNQGPSFPAHQFMFGGTSAPTADEDASGIYASENMTKSGITGTSSAAGCVAPATTTVQLIDSLGVEDPSNKVYPCFSHQALPDVLPPSNIVSWRYYTPSQGSIWTAPDALETYCDSTGPGGNCQGSLWANVDLKPADVLTDITSCKLANLSWVIPTGYNSDHASINDGGGPSWVASIVNAIGQSSKCDNNNGYWQDTAIIITWDDWGGWYDHVAPTFLNAPFGGYQLGFRVPMVFVSAYTPKGYINNSPHDFGSILRFIEGNFAVKKGALGFADARSASDLALFFDQTKAPRTFKTIAAPLSASFFINDTRTATDPDDQ